MAVYDIELTDLCTGQVFRLQVEGRNKKAAEVDARHRVESLRDPAPPGSPSRKDSALKLTLHNRLSEKDARRAFKACMQREGRWREVLAFRRERRAEVSRDHPLWNHQKVLDAVWSLAFAAFPSEPRSSKSAGMSAVEGVEELSGVELESAQVKLLEAALSSSDRGGIQDDTEWVYQNLDVPWDKIEVSSVPSPGGVGLLKQAKADPKWFLQTYHAKLLPTKSKFEAEGWFETDDGQIDDMAARIREEMALTLSDEDV